MADQSPIELEEEHGVFMDVMYEGAVQEWILYIRREILKAIGDGWEAMVGVGLA